MCVADPDLPQDVAESESQLSCQLQTVHVQQVLVKQTLKIVHTYTLDQPCFVCSICTHSALTSVYNLRACSQKGGEIRAGIV